ncbi:nuclear distribution protein nudE-like 1-A isoform X2 [Daphnia pulex]|uniref:nuclear distribution protein nudE-like 1-A isoform X2 n=1 Tax=Daphnia pulex TaxID=6669 RepID=UPI001EDFFDD6|nr:nuclear distribution protein nudE-like 1-A isoform X2 [Daphnia pulex]XP_046448480.1 nuclear distribution protein nudE-like 1-A isoform X2 [Daphnia pulex]XP_046448481.1 nuclear distribution protein nudE-like 1-A isoform X2 [Daphnia pulex]
MDQEKVPHFASAQEEARYWRLKAEEFQRIGEDARLELEEYQESSRELEAELETQIKQAEHQVRELRSNNHRLLIEHNSLKEKFEALSREHHTRVNELETHVHQLRAKNEDTTKRIRQLEQTNDDLERANRATLGSLEDFETRLHTAIERNAFLESELDDKESLAVMVQRLKDETKDLKQELQVRQKAIHETPDNEKQEKAVVDENEKSDPTKSPLAYPASNNNNKLPSSVPLKPLAVTDTGITQAARHSALNIVGDLLRRVGALENKLSTCRTMVKEGNGTVKEATRGKLLSRATSTAAPVQSIIRA